jgi:hypothetical protein
MTELSQALRESRRARSDETLSAATAALDVELGDAADTQKRFVIARLRSYAEACVRIARLIGTEKSPA